jgi:hypothetical protein
MMCFLYLGLNARLLTYIPCDVDLAPTISTKSVNDDAPEVGSPEDTPSFGFYSSIVNMNWTFRWHLLAPLLKGVEGRHIVDLYRLDKSDLCSVRAINREDLIARL